ncbi:MAG: ABC transporter ATP-binding protein [Planctomycetota bacterium]
MIQLNSLRKEYDDVIAVRNLTLTINKGDIFGLIGPNGAGKTTTMRMMVGILEPTSGEVIINNKPVQQDMMATRRLVGYIPDFFSLYDELKVYEYLNYYADAYKVPNKSSRIDEVIGLMDLTTKRSNFISHLSRGMKQRLAIGKTILHDPELLVLDEPSAGLDPKARVELRDILKKISSTGRTIIISSHILMELSDLCKTIGIMQKGVLVEQGSIEEITRRIQPKIVLRLEALGDKTNLAQFLKTLPNVVEIAQKDACLEIIFSGAREEIPLLLKKLVDNNIQVTAFYEYKQNLEELFISLQIKEVC